jgi:hypothetical protein
VYTVNCYFHECRTQTRRYEHVPREKYRNNAYRNLVRVPFNEMTTYKTTTEIVEKKSRTEYRRNDLRIMSNVRLSSFIPKTAARYLYSHDNSTAPDLLRHCVATHSEHTEEFVRCEAK